MKRLLDVAAAGVMLVLLGPLILLLALLIRIKLGSPVLFRQVRPGLQECPFTLFKFRTMRNAVDEHGHPLPDEQRLTGFGRLLRAASLDELPSLWNVLTGEMSLVGPRPLLMEYLPLYDDTQRRRHQVRPGITGWAQVNGRNNISWQRKLELDVWYVDNAGFLLDLRILAMTAFKIISRDGIAKDGHATTDRFIGNAND
jgi:sugar transferase EpsL